MAQESASKKMMGIYSQERQNRGCYCCGRRRMELDAAGYCRDRGKHEHMVGVTIAQPARLTTHILKNNARINVYKLVW